VWLNVPRRPLEASGTSGMKAGVNGALNVSVLDGWWAEAYAPDCGWAVGGGEQYDDPEEGDAAEAEALYTLLEREVVPLFFQRDASGRPREWIGMMTASIRRLGGAFSTGRMVREYAERAYLPAHRAWRALGEAGGEGARELAAWRERLAAAWPAVAVRAEVHGNGPVRVGERVEVAVGAFLGTLAPAEVDIEVVVGTADPAGDLVPREVIPAQLEGAAGGEHRYRAEIPALASGRLACAVRAVPRRPGSLAGLPAAPLPLVTWEADA
jgi:starch phosphorylase